VYTVAANGNQISPSSSVYPATVFGCHDWRYGEYLHGDVQRHGTRMYLPMADGIEIARPSYSSDLDNFESLDE
jgi:hypothetical protein